MAESAGSFTIGGTTPDYATIQLWDDDSATTLTGVLEGKCRAVTFDENIIIGGSTTTSSNYKKLTYDTGAFHAGVFGAGVVVNPAATKLDHVFQLTEDYTRVIGIEATDWNGASSEAFRVVGDECRIEQCMMHGAADINADGVHFGATNLTCYISNCFIGWLGRSGVFTQGTGANGFTIYVYNCTIIYCGSLDSSAHCAVGADDGNPPTSGTFHVKNTYGHRLTTDFTNGSAKAFNDGGGGVTWGNSTHNASYDATASDLHATNYQNNAATADQFTQDLTKAWCSENGDADYTCSIEDSWINSGAATTNYGSGTYLNIDNLPQAALFRVDCTNIPNTTRLKFAVMNWVIEDDEGFQSEWFKCLRNWTESGVTWNKYDGTNDWTTAGALSHNNDVYDHATYGGLSGVANVRSHSHNDVESTEGDWVRTTGGALFTAYVQSAIDGSSGAPKGDNWIDIIWRWLAGGTTELGVRSNDYTIGSRPELEIYYDTAAAPFDPIPDTAGVLDGNATDLSADGYPVSVDITGRTRSAWDIGAWSVGTDHEAVASVSAVITTNTPTAYRDVWRTASVVGALTTNTPTPERIIERTAAVTLEGQVGSTPLQNRGGDGTDLSWWVDTYGVWTVNAGAFRCTSDVGSADNRLNWLRFVPIDRLTDVVEWGMDVRMISGTVPSAVRVALREHTTDLDWPYEGNIQKYLNPQYVSIFTGTETTLTADLDDLDTFCTVASTAGWDVDGVTYLGLQYYIENDQSDLPNPNVIWLDRTDNIVSGSNINFHTAYSGSTIPSGTKVRMCASGGTFAYSLITVATGLDTSWTTMYNRITQPFEDISGGFSTTWAADGQNAMFPASWPGQDPPTSEATQGFRPTVTHVGLMIFTDNADDTTILEVDNIYIKTTNAAMGEVLHSADGAESLAITTTAVPRLTISAVELLNLTLDASAGEAGPVQYLRPSGDTTITNFEDEGAATTNLYQSVDEATPSDADYIVSTSGAGATYKGPLDTAGDPESSEMHVLKVRAESDGGVGMDATFSVYQNTTLIASWTVEDIPAGLVTYEFRMTQEQADTITDYTLLEWEIDVNPSVALLTYFPGDPVGTFTRTGEAWEWVP